MYIAYSARDLVSARVYTAYRPSRSASGGGGGGGGVFTR